MLFLLGCNADGAKPDAAPVSPAASAQPRSAPGSKTGSTTGSAPVISPAASAPAADANEPVIVCFGDSITAGYGLDPESSYPADMQRDLQAAGYRYRVLNMGVSGETTKDGLLRVPHVLDHRPEWVVVEFGGNDGLRGLPIPDAQHNLAAIVQALRRGGTHVLLAGISLPPQYGTEYVTQFNAMYPTVARQTNVPLLPFLYDKVYNVPGDIQDDGVHPTTEGAKQVALNVEVALKPMLRK